MLGSFGAPLEAMRTPVDAPEIRPARKRKAEAQDSNNERLSKRLGLLNLGNVAASVCPVLFCAALACGAADGMPPMAEQSGTKLYVPVEAPQPPAPPPTPSTSLPPSPDADADVSRQPRRRPRAPPEDDDSMQLDDSKHKVYINNLDDELSSESEAEDGKLVFLPDIEKHLRATRIPPAVLPNRDGELAACSWCCTAIRPPSPSRGSTTASGRPSSRPRPYAREAKGREGSQAARRGWLGDSHTGSPPLCCSTASYGRAWGWQPLDGVEPGRRG